MGVALKAGGPARLPQVLIRDSSGGIVGQIDIDSHTPAAFSMREEQIVRDVAAVLGAHWAEAMRELETRTA